MTVTAKYVAGAAIIAMTMGGQVFAQGMQQTLSVMKSDPQTAAKGFRASKVVGSPVVNQSNQTVGTVDDLIVSANDEVPFAVLSVGGFLGIGTKFVIVPYSALEVRDNQIVLVDATKESLKNLDRKSVV